MTFLEWIPAHYADACSRPFTTPQREAAQLLGFSIASRVDLWHSMYRAEGATTLAKGAALWALDQKLASFVLFVTSSPAAAANLWESLLGRLIENPPGERAQFSRAHLRITPSAGKALIVKSVTAPLVGLSHRGRRPDLVIVDSPYTAEALRSPSRKARIDDVLRHDLPRIGGPTKPAPVVVLNSLDGDRPR